MCFWLSKRMMDRLGESKLEDLGLETSFQEVLDFETENVIELHAAFIQDTNANKTTQQCVSLKKSAGIFILKGQKVTGGLTDLGQGVLNPPDLTPC